MIEMLPDMPPGVTGVRVSGRLSGQELREVRPTLEKSLKSGEIRIVEVIDSDYQGFGPGGLVEDLKLGLGAVLPHHSAFRRIAVVSTRSGSRTPCTRWPGWCPASSPCSDSASWSVPSSGPRARTRSREPPTRGLTTLACAAASPYVGQQYRLAHPGPALAQGAQG